MAEHATLDEVVTESMRSIQVPGVAVGLLHDGIEETFGFGVTSIENPLPVDPQTLFQIGSITKTFTATLLMQLAGRGRLDLDAPIRSVLPDFRLQDEQVAARATPRHLLTHTGGWQGDEFSDTGDGDDALADYVANLAQLPQIAPLGELFSYCNTGFSIAGRLIEVVTGKKYERAARELLIDPLGMTRSFFEPAAVMTHRFAVGHFSPFSDAEQPRVLRPWPLPRAARSAGGLVSNVVDILLYARLHLGLVGSDLLPVAPRVAMQDVWAPAGNFADAVGASWLLRGPAERRIVGHDGSTLGQQATLEMVPSRSFAVVVLTNGSRGGVVHERVAAWALRQYAGLIEPEPSTYTLGSDELVEYAGRYEQVLHTAELVARDGGLVVQTTPKGGFPTKDSPPGPTPPPARFEFCAQDAIIGREPPSVGARAEFLRGPDGRIKWLRIGGRLAARQ